MCGVCSPGGHQGGGGPAGVRAALPLSAQRDGPRHPLGKAGQVKRVGGCAPPAEEGQGGWEKTVAVPGTKGQSSTHMERKERGSWGSTG